MDGSELNQEIENCRECGNPMNVTSFAPFSEVQCPECHNNVHVKTDVGSYEIVAKQGVGGMSLVFKAVDKTLGRKVAIKLLNESYSSDAKRIEEFEKEAKITAAISHPNVVRVFTVGQAYGRYFIAMELVDGESLEQRIAMTGKLAEEMVARLAIEVVEGLKSAHQAGLIHRDMKPGNILIDSSGRAKIVDFGLALVTSGGKALAEEIWATPYYVPPETLKLQEEDLRSDVYALAASLYHALSGEPPFTTDTTSTSELLKIKATVPKLSSKTEGVSPHMCAVIDKAMAFEASERFQSYDELLDALKQLDAFYRTGTIPEPLNKRKSESSRRNGRSKFPVVPVAGGAMALALAVGYFSQSPPTDSEPVVKPVTVQEEDASENEQALRVFIATELKVAQNLFKQREYQEAHLRYLKIALTPEVPTETVFWAGLQSASSAWLNADTESARSALDQVRDKLSSEKDSEQSFVAVLENLGDFEPVIIPENLSPSLETSIRFSAGLKEWEQGRWDLARQLFQSVIATNGSGYLRVVKGYLADYEALEHYPEALKDLNVEQANGLIAELADAETLLNTKGRAVFNITQWKRQAEEHKSKLLSEKKLHSTEKKLAKEEAQTAWKETKSKVINSASNYWFRGVTRDLQKADPPNEKEKKWGAAMLFFSEQAGELYMTTFKLFADKSGEFVVLNKSGEKQYDKILGAKSDGLIVSAEGKPEKVLAWAALLPHSMWELHKVLPDASVPEELRIERRKQLACYAYLTGLEENAQLLANIVFEMDPEFAENWELSVGVLEEEKRKED